MTALSKTKSLERVDLPVGQLVKNAKNPNKMGAREFDLLCDNIGQTGLTDPILVRPDGDKYRIVGGHHRYDAAVYLGFAEVPCTVITDPGFDEEMEQFQLVRMNTIRGKLDPNAFFSLYQSLSQTYSDEILQDAFGFAEEAEFKKLVNATAKQLPDKHLQEKFKEAAKEIKTIDGLAKLLNQMFTMHGDTLPYGYMVFDHAGQRSAWLRVNSKTMNAIDILGELCVEKQRTLDDVVGKVLQLIAKGGLKETVDEIIAKTQAVQLPDNLQVLPTKDNLATLEEI